MTCFISSTYAENIIANLKVGTLPLSITTLEDPVDTTTTVKETRSSVDTTYLDTYSDGSIMVRGMVVVQEVGSVKYTASNVTLDAMSRAKFSRIQGKNNDQVTSAYDGFVGYHIYGKFKTSVCKKMKLLVNLLLLN